MTTITVDVSEQVRDFGKQVERAIRTILDAGDDRDAVVARMEEGTRIERWVAEQYWQVVADNVEVVFTCPDCKAETVVTPGVVACACGYELPLIEVEGV